MANLNISVEGKWHPLLALFIDISAKDLQCTTDNILHVKNLNCKLKHGNTVESDTVKTENHEHC